MTTSNGFRPYSSKLGMSSGKQGGKNACEVVEDLETIDGYCINKVLKVN